MKRGWIVLPAVLLIAGCGSASKPSHVSTPDLRKLQAAYVSVSQLCASVEPNGKPSPQAQAAATTGIDSYIAGYKRYGSLRFSFAPGTPANTMPGLIRQAAQEIKACDPSGSAQLSGAIPH
jgi:hypothetical protein